MASSPLVGRFDDITGPLVYVRAVAVRGYPVLAEPDTARHVTTELVRTLRRFDSEAIAYCVLPGRMHILAAGLGAAANPRAGIRRWKQVTGYGWYVRTGRRLWCERCFVHELDGLAGLDAAAAYLVGAPVRGGLVPRGDLYRWVFATRWTVAELARRPPGRAPRWWRERIISGSRTGYSLPR